MGTATISKMADEHLLKIYNRFPIALDHGEGVYLYDADGKKYLDFQAGIAVCSLGYSNEKYKSALKDQIDKLTHTSNLYYNEVCADAANALAKISGMDRVFFTNSGTEAIEGIIKTVGSMPTKRTAPRIMRSSPWSIPSTAGPWVLFP